MQAYKEKSYLITLKDKKGQAASVHEIARRPRIAITSRAQSLLYRPVQERDTNIRMDIQALLLNVLSWHM
jgi:hypothetical protein